MRTSKDMSDLLMAWVETEIQDVPVWHEDLGRQMAEDEFEAIIKAHDAEVINTYLEQHIMRKTA